jgi:hypothetical protein
VKSIARFYSIPGRNISFPGKFTKFPELHDEKWGNDVYFLYDMTCHINKLNLQLQGKVQLMFEKIAVLKFFKINLRLFKIQPFRGEVGHFAACKKHIPLSKQSKLGESYSNDIEILIQLCENRLSLSKETGVLLRLTEYHFSSDAEEFYTNMQLEVNAF